MLCLQVVILKFLKQPLTQRLDTRADADANLASVESRFNCIEQVLFSKGKILQGLANSRLLP